MFRDKPATSIERKIMSPGNFDRIFFKKSLVPLVQDLTSWSSGCKCWSKSEEMVLFMYLEHYVTFHEFYVWDNTLQIWIVHKKIIQGERGRERRNLISWYYTQSIGEWKYSALIRDTTLSFVPFENLQGSFS